MVLEVLAPTLILTGRDTPHRAAAPHQGQRGRYTEGEPAAVQGLQMWLWHTAATTATFKSGAARWRRTAAVRVCVCVF